MAQSTIESYNPHEHLVQIKSKDGTMKDYYPANWRLYELRLRYPHITIESEIIHMDVEHNFVIIKASIFDGKTYEESSMRATAMKQGLLSALDKVETAAKARASRDYGIGTELALDMDEEIAPGGQDASEALATVKAEVKELGLARNPQQWTAFKKKAIGRDLPDNKISSVHIVKLRSAIEQAKNQAA